MMINILLHQNLILKIDNLKQDLQNFNHSTSFYEIVDLADTGAVYNSCKSFADKSFSSLHFNQSQTTKKNTRINCDFGPQPRKIYSIFFPLPFCLH